MDSQTLERDLAGDDAQRRAAAARAFNELGARDCREFLSRIGGRFTLSDHLVFFGPIAIFAALLYGLGRLTDTMSIACLLAIWLPLGGSVVGWSKAKRDRRLCRGLTEAIARIDSPRVLSAVLELRDQHDRFVNSVGLAGCIDDACRRVLLETNVSDLRRTPLTDLETLLWWNQDNPYFDADVTVHCIDLVRQLQDDRLLGEVRRLARGPASTPTKRTVRDAARACLEAFDERNRKSADERTLLRASTTDESQPDTLLRAATHAGVTSTDQLLRPGM